MAANRNLLTGFLFKRGKRRGAASLIKDRTNDASDVVLDSWLFDSGATSITGTLSTTEGVDSLSATGEASGGAVEGSFTATEGADAISGSGLVIVSGSFAATETADSLSTSGSVLVGGVGALSETTASLAATGLVVVGSVLSAVEAEDAASASGDVLVEGVSELVEDSYSLSALGDVSSKAIDGTFSATEDADTLIAYGSSPEAITGGYVHYKRIGRSQSEREKELERIKLGISEAKQEAATVAKQKTQAIKAQAQGKEPRQDVYALTLHEALVREEIASLMAQEAILKASLAQQFYEVRQRLAVQEAMRLAAIRQQTIEADLAFVMTMLAEV